MKFFHKAKDGGPESNVTGYWLIEWKAGFSIALLCFSRGSREAYHSHAFNAWSWVLKGLLEQWALVQIHDEDWVEASELRPSFKPVYTPRECMHKVHGVADKTWVLSIRGPWVDTWKEYFDKDRQYVTLTHGRKVVA